MNIKESTIHRINTWDLGAKHFKILPSFVTIFLIFMGGLAIYSGKFDNDYQGYYTKSNTSMEYSEYKALKDSCENKLHLKVENNTVIEASCQ